LLILFRLSKLSFLTYQLKGKTFFAIAEKNFLILK
jgi:hypothetical protein